jgi:NarL family two-component system sensor histidine kinase LiaS
VESAAQQHALVEQNARLAERTRISRDLHDSVKQRLFAVALQVGVALSLAETADARVRQHLQEADGLIAQAQQDLTALIHELRPSALQQKGLPTALRDFAADWSRQHAIPVDLTVADTSELSFEAEEALWHITGEAFSNIARHSGATRAGLRLDATPTQVTLDITDNGHGFAPAANGNATGVGLHSMHERLDAIGGSLTVESDPATGTRLVARCPLAAVGGAMAADGATGETTRARNEALL